MPTSTIDEELRVRGGVEEDEELAQQVELPAADSEGAAGRGISEEEGDCRWVSSPCLNCPVCLLGGEFDGDRPDAPDRRRAASRCGRLDFFYGPSGGCLQSTQKSRTVFGSRILACIGGGRSCRCPQARLTSKALEEADKPPADLSCPGVSSSCAAWAWFPQLHQRA